MRRRVRQRWTSVPTGVILAVALAALSACPHAFAFDLTTCEKDELPYAAAEACDKAISAQAKPPLEPGRAFTLRGYAWIREGEPGGAVSDFTRAIAINATNISALKGRARAYTALRRYDDAIADLTRAISLRPNGEEHFRERGRTYLEMGNAKEAFADYDHAIEIQAKNPEGYIGRAHIYQRLNMRDAALREFDKAVAADPTYPNTYFAKAQAAESWGDADLAISSYALVVRYNGDVWYAQRAMKRLGKQFSDLEHPDSTMPKKKD